MATQAQKTAELNGAQRRVDQTTKKLEQAKQDVESLTKKLKVQTESLEWIKSMPVSDDDEPETDRS